jgi:hypothetical protein
MQYGVQQALVEVSAWCTLWCVVDDTDTRWLVQDQCATDCARHATISVEAQTLVHLSAAIRQMRASSEMQRMRSACHKGVSYLVDGQEHGCIVHKVTCQPDARAYSVVMHK